MKRIFEFMVVALSMYSTIPMPNVRWDERNMRYAICFFPLVGTICGITVFVLWKISSYFNLSSFLFSGLATTLIVLLTGGIHIDGFCDTIDAICSRRSKEEKLRILKDPTCGPFAVMGIILIFLLMFVSFNEIFNKPNIWVMIGAIFMLSRSLSGISVVTFPSAKSSTLVKMFEESSAISVKYILIIQAILYSGIMIYCSHLLGSVCVLSCLLVWGFYYLQSKKLFGGITGDLAGYFLVLCETIGLLVVAIMG